ncbi:MAG: hypothetical protein HY301_06885 [Verrucomicrobia bacterium]|nr:hypothetical protein [Verrucomicrobiota bacterium]
MKVMAWRLPILVVLAVFIFVVVGAWIIELAGFDQGLLESQLTAAPLKFLSRAAFIAVLPVSVLAMFAGMLPKSILVTGATVGILAFVIILGANLSPRSWRIANFPAPSDNDAWERANRQIASGNPHEWIGWADGIIIWYVKGVGASTEEIVFSFLCSIPGAVFALELALLRKLQTRTG